MMFPCSTQKFRLIPRAWISVLLKDLQTEGYSSRDGAIMISMNSPIRFVAYEVEDETMWILIKTCIGSGSLVSGQERKDMPY